MFSYQLLQKEFSYKLCERIDFALGRLGSLILPKILVGLDRIFCVSLGRVL